MSSEDAPRWLDAEEQRTWRELVGVLVRLPAELDRQLRRDSGLSHYEYQVLAVLSEAEERTLRMRDLAASTEGSLPRLSQVVARLERPGWVRRHPDPDDGRTTLATLTGAGLEQVVAAAPGHVEAVRRLVFDPLTAAQRRQIGTISRRITGAIAVEDAQDPDR
ncbi:MAG: MarR family winged helix-turn-helix transcriptional regulator [Microthrixaceae bacterium]